MSPPCGAAAGSERQARRLLGMVPQPVEGRTEARDGQDQVTHPVAVALSERPATRCGSRTVGPLERRGAGPPAAAPGPCGRPRAGAAMTSSPWRWSATCIESKRASWGRSASRPAPPVRQAPPGLPRAGQPAGPWPPTRSCASDAQQEVADGGHERTEERGAAPKRMTKARKRIGMRLAYWISSCACAAPWRPARGHPAPTSRPAAGRAAG